MWAGRSKRLFKFTFWPLSTRFESGLFGERRGNPWRIHVRALAFGLYLVIRYTAPVIVFHKAIRITAVLEQHQAKGKYAQKRMPLAEASEIAETDSASKCFAGKRVGTLKPR
jgi:hypothetical protein